MLKSPRRGGGGLSGWLGRGVSRAGLVNFSPQWTCQVRPAGYDSVVEMHGMLQEGEVLVQNFADTVWNYVYSFCEAGTELPASVPEGEPANLLVHQVVHSKSWKEKGGLEGLIRSEVCHRVVVAAWKASHP